jgi:phosphatidylglycerol:prolipoprotein diacylglycerol transferase
MITISIDPVIFSIGHFALRWYGLIQMTAVGIGLWLVGREAERKGFSKSEIYDAAIWIMLAGLLGARLFHVIDHWPHEYAMDPIRALYIWEGGLAIWGAIVGGLIAVVIVARKRRWKLPRLLDAFVPGVVLGQAVGRVACIITGDAMGPPTSGPFGIAYTNPSAMVPQLGVYYTPMPVYEIIANLAIFCPGLVFAKPQMDGWQFVPNLSDAIQSGTLPTRIRQCIQHCRLWFEPVPIDCADLFDGSFRHLRFEAIKRAKGQSAWIGFGNLEAQ